jgi:hypothetical protein
MRPKLGPHMVGLSSNGERADVTPRRVNTAVTPRRVNTRYAESEQGRALRSAPAA